MILESVVIVTFALLLDFLVGDPKTRYHPTAWIGKLIASLVPFTKSMIINDTIKPDILPPIKNLRITHKPNAIINERNNGQNISCNGTS